MTYIQDWLSLFNIFLINFQKEIVLFWASLLILGLLGLLLKSFYKTIKATEIESDFTKIINHTFRTPLTRIGWLLNEAKNSQVKSERDELIDQAQDAQNKLLTIVDTILGIQNARSTAGYVFKAISIREIIEDSLAKNLKLADKKSLHLNIPKFENLPLLTADLKKITFAFGTLIENAITYSPERDFIQIDCQIKNNKLIFSVKDNGIGITPNEQFNIFSKFYRSERAQKFYPDGLGLSLYLTKIIISRHGGQVYFKSNGENLGTQFFIELPLK